MIYLTDRLAGYLTDRCEILRREVVEDEYGHPVTRLVTVRSEEPCRMLRDNRANPTVQALEALHVPESMRIVVRSICPLDAGFVVRHGDRTYEVAEMIADVRTDGPDRQAYIRRYREDAAR